MLGRHLLPERAGDKLYTYLYNVLFLWKIINFIVVVEDTPCGAWAEATLVVLGKASGAGDWNLTKALSALQPQAQFQGTLFID